MIAATAIAARAARTRPGNARYETPGSVTRPADKDTIDTPNGTIRAQHFIRLPRRLDDHRRVEIWLSPERGWLPVRLRQTEPNGTQFDLIYQSQEGG